MSDPTRGYSLAARPWAVVAWGAVVYTLVVLVPAISLWIEEADQGDDTMFAWALLTVGFCVPVGLVVGLVAASRERLITRRDRPGRFAWIGYGIGATGLGHWLVMLPYSLVAIVNGIGSTGSTAERYFESAVYGLIAWLGVACFGGVCAATLAGFRRRTLAESRMSLPEIPHLIPSTALAGLLGSPLMLVCTMFVASGGDGHGYAIPMVFVVGGIGGMAGLGLAWSGAAAETEAARAGGPAASWATSFGTYFGAFLAVQWGTAFAVTLLPVWDSAIGQRFLLQMACVAILSVGAALVGRGLARPGGVEPGAVAR
ncbi:MAG: hypothetical protein H6737_26820 [Alphaproteobacteria bacterium]|nr:hypothetical protein [Alphaproteobacteria bacterium]